MWPDGSSGSRAHDNHHVTRAKALKKKIENGEDLNEVGAEASHSNHFTAAFFEALERAEAEELDR